MKILQTEITTGLNSYVSVIERDEPYFEAPFHFHPELELVYIKEGYGKRIIGNRIEHFEAGDMVFIGANLPHVWLNDELFYTGLPLLRAKAIVVYFNKDVFGEAFYGLAEARKLNDFFKQAERGVQINGKTKNIIAQKLEALVKKKGFDKIIGLLELLHQLSTSKEISFINEERSLANNYKTDHDRLSGVHRYVQANFNNEISLTKIAGLANLTPTSFCRLFKKRTGKNFVEYLNEIRINHACTYLIETDWSIAEIAYACGYKSAQSFNKLFKEIMATSPGLYRLKAGA